MTDEELAARCKYLGHRTQRTGEWDSCQLCMAAWKWKLLPEEAPEEGEKRMSEHSKAVEKAMKRFDGALAMRREFEAQLADKDREIEKLRAELEEALWNEQSSATAYGKLRAAAGEALEASNGEHPGCKYLAYSLCNKCGRNVLADALAKLKAALGVSG